MLAIGSGQLVNSLRRPVRYGVGKVCGSFPSPQQRRWLSEESNPENVLHGKFKVKDTKVVHEISVDISKIPRMRSFDAEVVPTESSSNDKATAPHKEEMTSLAKELQSYIMMKGPISVHDFMSFCLNHPMHGYYQKRDVKKIGKGGDFITAPEISELFGEMICIWLMSSWLALGSPKPVNIIEMGPGNGTLMADILRVLRRFPAMKSCIEVQLLERSDYMRQLQREKLGCQPVPGSADSWKAGDTTVNWFNFLEEIPSDRPSLIIGQEFLDVFPVHQFVYTQKGWRERLIDLDRDSASPYHFQIVLSPSETPAIKALFTEKVPSMEMPPKTAGHFTAKQDPLSALIQKNAAEQKRQPKTTEKFEEGDQVEFSPLALSICEDIATRVKKSRGAAIFIDYGRDAAQADTIRAFSKHKLVDFLSIPGQADMTVDVDFRACAQAAAKKDVKVYPLMTQQEFLMRMGITHRLERYIQKDSVTDEQAKAVIASCNLLLSPEHMGERFKVLAMSDKETLLESIQSTN